MAVERLAEMPQAHRAATGGGCFPKKGADGRARRRLWVVGALDLDPLLRSAGEAKPKSGVEAAVAMPVSRKALFSDLRGEEEKSA